MNSNFFDSSKSADCRCGSEADHSECGRFCGADKMTSLITRLEITEGDILDYITANPSISLNQLIQDLDYQPCLLSMAVAFLIKDGIVKADECGHEVLLKLSKAA